MMSSRLMIRYPELHGVLQDGKDKLSVDQHLEHNVFNQGCHGGYPYLVALWGAENDLLLNSDYDAGLDKRGKAAAGRAAEKQAPRPLRVSHFHYVGGAFGRCGMHHLCEEAMREELYK